MGGFLAIASKYVLQYRNNHLWNPTNFAITMLLLAAPSRVSVLSHQFGNDLLTNLVIWGFGLAITTRVRVVHITHIETSTLAAQPARAKGRKGTLMTQFSKRVGLIHKL